MAIIEEPTAPHPLGLEDVWVWLADRGAPGAAVERAAAAFHELGRQLTVVQDHAGIRGVAVLRKDRLWVVDAKDREAALSCAASLGGHPRAALTSAACATWLNDAWAGLEHRPRHAVVPCWVDVPASKPHRADSAVRWATSDDLGGLRASLEHPGAVGEIPWQDLVALRLVAVSRAGGALQGWAALSGTTQRYVCIGAIWAQEDRRGRGVATGLVDFLAAEATASDRQLLLSRPTPDPAWAALASSSGLRAAEDLHLLLFDGTRVQGAS
jgi:hypothetical protein